MEDKVMTGKGKKVLGIFVMFCILAITALTGIAKAHEGEWGDGGGHFGKHHHCGFGMMENKLGLTDAQKAQAKAIFQANKTAVKPLFSSLKTERKNLRALMFADKVDETAIRAETAKIAGIQADLNVNRAKVAAQFRAILTPDQLNTLKTLHQKHECTDKTTTTTPAPTK